jgi:polyisoprenoid-binding protein YceI
MIVRSLVLAFALCPAAVAGVLEADGASGTLEFTATQAGARFTGAFRRFEVRLDLDPANPAQGSLDVTVETASIDTRDAERDEVLKSADFFWVDRHPQAVFHAVRFERDGAAWRAPGELTIRGVKKTVPVLFTLEPESGGAMKGSARLQRLAFGLGQGDWASTEWVGDEVDVRFELKLLPATGAAKP